MGKSKETEEILRGIQELKDKAAAVMAEAKKLMEEAKRLAAEVAKTKKHSPELRGKDGPPGRKKGG